MFAQDIGKLGGSGCGSHNGLGICHGPLAGGGIVLYPGTVLSNQQHVGGVPRQLHRRVVDVQRIGPAESPQSQEGLLLVLTGATLVIGLTLPLMPYIDPDARNSKRKLSDNCPGLAVVETSSAEEVPKHVVTTNDK